MKKRGLSQRLNQFKKGEVLFPLAIFLFFLLLLRNSYEYPPESRAFPQLVILGTLILSAILLTVYFLSPTLSDTLVEPESDEENSTAFENRTRFLRGWIIISLSLATAFFFGFVFLIPASFISYVLLLGRKTLFIRILLLSLGTALLVYIVFDRFLHIPMLGGFLWTL